MNKILSDYAKVREGHFWTHYMGQLAYRMNHVGEMIINERIDDENILDKAFQQGRYAGLKEALQLPDSITKKLSNKESTGDTANQP